MPLSALYLMAFPDWPIGPDPNPRERKPAPSLPDCPSANPAEPVLTPFFFPFEDVVVPALEVPSRRGHPRGVAQAVVIEAGCPPQSISAPDLKQIMLNA